MGSGLSFAPGERLCSQSRNSQSFNSVEYEMISYRDKKKKSSRFATMCKRFIKARRHNRQLDYSKHVKELTSNWCISEIESLANEYECMVALKELAVMANLARSNGSSIVEDLTSLYQNKYCADVDLIYLDTVYPAHKSILCVRCSFFRELLLHVKGHRPKVEVNLKTQGVDNNLFSALLRYLYTGDFGMDVSSLHRLKPILSQLALEFGAPNSLKQDLRTLYETGVYSDAVLAFSLGTASQCYSPCTPSHQQHKSFQWKTPRNHTFPMPCHKAILAARSSFFRNLINRRIKNEAAEDDKSDSMFEQFNKKTVILLDESVIPARFASILLSSIYLDSIDLNSHMSQQQQQTQEHTANNNNNETSHNNNNEQLRSSASCCSSKKFLFQHLTSASASLPSSTSHSCHNTTSVPTSLSSSLFAPTSSSSSSSSSSFLEEAMELYHIARFLDFPTLAQSCEDMVVEQLSVDNLLNILKWSNESHGSTWVYRQALHYLSDEFIHFSQCPAFLHLDKSYFVQVLHSDFLQASELDLLSCIIKWGECKLIKSIEEQEPNLLSNTAHSVTKKGVKRRDLNDHDLLQIVSDLLCHVRLDHLVPRNHEVVSSAIRRRLIPPFQVSPSSASSNNQASYPSSPWLNGDMTFYPKPRLFTPFYEEVKNLIKEYHAKSEQQQFNFTRSCYGNITGNKSCLSNTNKIYEAHKRLMCSTTTPTTTRHTCTSPATPTTRPPTTAAVPDTLYMLEAELSHAPFPPPPSSHHRLHKCWSFSSSTVDIIAGTILVPDKKVVEAMQRREAELMAGRLLLRDCQRGSPYRSAVIHQIRLRIVREFGLPDSAVKVLKGSSLPAHLSPPDTVHPSPQLSRFTDGAPFPFQTPLRKAKQHCHQHTLHRFPLFSKNRNCSCNNICNVKNNNCNNNDSSSNNSNNTFCCHNSHKNISTYCKSVKSNHNSTTKHNNNFCCSDETCCSGAGLCDDKNCYLANTSSRCSSHHHHSACFHHHHHHASSSSSSSTQQQSAVFFMNPHSFFRSSSPSFSPITPSNSCHFKCQHQNFNKNNSTATNYDYGEFDDDDIIIPYPTFTTSATSPTAAAMPDIAMATTTSMATTSNASECFHNELMALSDLDLGDGSSHSGNPSSLFL